MKNLSFISLLLILGTACNQVNLNPEVLSKPDGYEGAQEEEMQKDSLREIYLKEVYFAAEGTNVDSIRSINRQNNYRQKQVMRSQTAFRSGETFANGLIEATWHERGPVNEAGDMREVDFLPSTEAIYGISTVGHLWKGNLNGLTWKLLNDDIQFEPDEIEVVPHNGGTRIFAIFGTGVDDKKIRYSDDEGQTWTTGTGFSFYDHWGRGRRLLTLSDNQTLYYLVNTWSGNPWGSVVQLYKTTNKGVSYTKVWQSSTGYAGNSDEVDLWKPYDSDQMYLIDNKTQQFYEVTHNFGNGATTISSPVAYGSQGVATGAIHVSGRYNSTLGDYELFICLGANNNVYKTVNGATWTFLSTASTNVWRKGWLADPDNNNLYAGGFQLNKTSNGVNWAEQYAQWWEYYKNTPTQKDSMHVDIMNLDYFKKSNGTPFIIILNHAGIHVTYDHFVTTKNLGLNDLNDVTLYDQTTASDGFLYCGAQDKGNFKYGGNSTANFNQLSTDNMSTADGMLGVFFNSDQSFYAMIQNGTLFCFKDRNVNSYSSYTIPGTDKPGWINPMVATADFADHKAYVAGGNLSGGSGSYLITADVNISGGVTWQNTQFNYNFMAYSNDGVSVIKAIGVSFADPNRIYVSTKDATFFSSANAGTSWTKHTMAGLSATMIPWDIITSATNADEVFICGTGFSNPGVYRSMDGGATFSVLGGNLPSATFYEIALSDTEEYLFAATSEGPYVYAFATATWYSLIGAETPIVDFNTVDNLGDNIIRFGTYGRGVWDLELNNVVLPVELVSFTAKPFEHSKARLNWATARETNLENFTLEHSADGTDFTVMGMVVAEGNFSGAAYQFIHEDPQPGKNFYRLKMTDINGTADYSTIETVDIEIPAQPFRLYPNLVAQNGMLHIVPGDTTPFIFEVYSVKGQRVFKQKMAGTNIIQADFPVGFYVYRMSAGQSMVTGKLVVD
ncbi:MAG: T9SS type A sorting domain-containing protein [Saprospiraceae bacterium]|nr:T9SS type A sorting domain-containing protein [Saprospiraceae bacterium]MCB9323860.1 T9SS type A sorting domain-containing protein [Lewinellaceae bacterium]